MPALLGCLGVVALIIALYLLHGTALYFLWQWFIVPLGAPQIGIAWAIGIGLIIGYMTNHETPKEGQKGDAVQTTVASVMRPILALAIGWLIQYFWGPFHVV